MNIISKLFYLSIIFSCIKSDSIKTLDLNVFTINTIDSWKYIERRGIDSFIGEIAIDKKDTLNFDYGFYSNTLEEDLDYIIREDSILSPDFEKDKLDTINSPHYKFYALRKDINLEDLRKNKYYFQNIAGLRARIVVPKRPGIGMTGIYFENTSKKRKGIRLQISGHNLSQENQELFINAMKTIKFRK